jgi:hypothetical protein
MVAMGHEVQALIATEFLRDHRKENREDEGGQQASVRYFRR